MPVFILPLGEKTGQWLLAEDLGFAFLTKA
jgi:hypothetical protein